MIGIILARRYAKAIIDLAGDENIVAEVGSDLDRLGELFTENPSLVHVFSDPTVSLGDKETVLRQILEKGAIKELTLKFVHVLLEKNRILGIGEIARSYQELADDLENRVRARVVAAAPLDEADEERLKKALSRLSGKEVIIQLEVDESLLGGVVAYVGGQVYDGSLSNQLQQVKESLSKGR